jgi:CspA family cold shock protein
MEKGTVVWFDTGKGFGFVRGEDGTDVFVHYSAIESQNKRKNLQPDQRVEFERKDGPKGPFASLVRVVTD